MSLETQSAKQIDKYYAAGEAVMTPQIKSAINSYSIAGAFAWILPLFGAETIIYAIILWCMYGKVARLAKRKFGFAAVCGGFLINLMICLVGNLMLEFLDVFLGLGFIVSAICGYLLTYTSGKSFLGYLAKNTR